MEPNTDTKSVATRASTSTDAQVIRSPKEYTDRLQVWQRQQYHVLTPFANFSALPDHFGLVPTLVYIDPNPDAGDVYEDRLFCKDGEVAIAKIGLSKIAMAAGMTITTVRTDDRRIQNLWEMRATARFVGIDGTPQSVDGTEELDLRDGSDRSQKVMGKNRSQDALRAARAKGLRGCEARAINAAIRQFGIRQKYTKAELGKPFVLVRVVYMPDMNDAATRQQVTERALAGSSALYGGGHALAAAAEPEVVSTIGVDGDVIDVTPQRTEPARPADRGIEDVSFDTEAGLYSARLDGGEVVTVASVDVGKALAAAKKAAQRIVPDITPDGVLTLFTLAAAEPEEQPIGHTNVANVHREKAKAPKTWVRYDVTFLSGQKASTFDTKLHAVIDEAEKTRAAVKISTEENGDYDPKLTAIDLVDQRQGTLPIAGQEKRY
ncbi:MAG: hypothetical protein ABI634_12865 [Acidobacteriota bacterium]